MYLPRSGRRLRDIQSMEGSAAQLTTETSASANVAFTALRSRSRQRSNSCSLSFPTQAHHIVSVSLAARVPCSFFLPQHRRR
jgi:hypothetical protein